MEEKKSTTQSVTQPSSATISPTPSQRRRTRSAGLKRSTKTRIFHRFNTGFATAGEGVEAAPTSDLCCTVDDILCADSPPADTDSEYPQFDDIGAYAITEHTVLSETIWRNEANRLFRFLENPEEPAQFKNRDFFKVGDEAAHKSLSALADKIFTAMSLCVLDNECITVRFSPQASSRTRLKKLIMQAQVASQANDGSKRLDREAYEREQVAMFDLVDYISVVLSRLITQTGAGNHWQASVLCALVKRVAKIKIMLLDLAENADLAAKEGESVLEDSRDARDVSSGMIEEEEECEEILRIIAAETRDGLTSFQSAQVASYCVNQSKVRSGLDILMRSIIMPLRCLNRSGLGHATYEIAGLVYETGFQGFKTLLYQDRELEYSATSNLDNLKAADPAFRMLNQTVRHMKNLHQGGDPSDIVRGRDVRTFIEWTYSGATTGHTGDSPARNDKKLESLELEYMDEIITVMVPLVTTDPKMVSELNSFRSIVVLSKENRDPVREHEDSDFAAFFRMHTNTFDDERGYQSTMRLKTAFDDGYFERCRLIDPEARNDSSSELIFDLRAKIMEHEWVMDETSVVVSCPRYVLSVMAVAVILGAGGLVIGFTVGDRIEAVDPFQIASYAWLFAAFVILVCKSVLVREWSWADFLRSRVRCRSVSELEAVTGFPGQMIIAKLLHDESSGGILSTRGPYNSVFLRRNNEGFSIDQPISTSTMLMSGLTPLKVVTPKGYALVCLDSRHKTRLRVIEHQADPKEQYLVCEDVSRKQRRAREGDGAAEKLKSTKLQLFLTRDVKWKRVLGIYDAENVVFV
ncbi:hypothetical protein OOU_Y34scaffold00979g12 [Pyricularia oryzae Y34]|nr:hypothetical protein OOU_Y34scaffold00979g12 [Pyricularia oryzae Y34]